MCGNDFYNGAWTDAFGLAAADFCQAARARCEHVFAVVGMSAKTWQYSSPRAPAYDVACLSLKRAFVDAGVACVSGIAELQGLKLADAIGHVHEDSAGAVFAAYKSWVRRCVVAESQPKELDVPEQEELQSPLPPPLEPLPAAVTTPRQPASESLP